jgi:hypothetical protein
MGSHTSPEFGNLNPSGITPTIVRRTPDIVVIVPMTSGSDEKCRRQRLSRISATGASPGLPSSARSARPRTGVDGKTPIEPGVSVAPLIGTISPDGSTRFTEVPWKAPRCSVGEESEPLGVDGGALGLRLGEGVEQHEPVAVGVGESAVEHRVQQSEPGGRHADADREREERSQRHDGLLAEQAQRQAKFQHFQSYEPAGFLVRWNNADRGPRTELEPANPRMREPRAAELLHSSADEPHSRTTAWPVRDR